MVRYLYVSQNSRVAGHYEASPSVVTYCVLGFWNALNVSTFRCSVQCYSVRGN